MFRSFLPSKNKLISQLIYDLLTFSVTDTVSNDKTTGPDI